MNIDGTEILITGGTGSLGKTLVKLLLKEHRPKGIRVFSRDELKQWSMHQEIERWRVENECSATPVAYLVGDVRDLHRLKRAMDGVNIVIHAAALKQVGSCEDNPMEAIKTNVHGAENVINAAIDCSVKRVMNVSTDKAVKSVNLYGTTKATAEKLFIAANVYSGGREPRFSCCRYGNVLASRGSVAHVFRDQIKNGETITITHPAMTRFWITLPTVTRFLLNRIQDMNGGEIFIPKMKSMSVYEMAHAMSGQNKKLEYKTTGIRQGEKLHESLFHEYEYAYEKPEYYCVFSSIQQNIGKHEMFELSSDKNPIGNLVAEELLTMLENSEI